MTNGHGNYDSGLHSGPASEEDIRRVLDHGIYVQDAQWSFVLIEGEPEASIMLRLPLPDGRVAYSMISQATFRALAQRLLPQFDG